MEDRIKPKDPGLKMRLAWPVPLVEETVQEARALSEDIVIDADIADRAVVAADEYYLPAHYGRYWKTWVIPPG